MSREVSTRLIGWLASLSMHTAIGAALLWAWDKGTPVRDVAGGDRGSVLIVELIPLDPADGRARDDNPQRGEMAEALSQPRPPEASGLTGDPDPLPRAAGPESDGMRASAEAQGEAHDLANLPNADVLAYRRRLEAHLARYRLYPAGARDAGREGVVMLHFTMSREGRVIQAWVGESSGATDIDREAVAAVMRAQPLPAFPEGWPGQLSVVLPVTFRLG